MLRKILNIIIILVIVGAISVVFINLYNNSKLESNNFENSTEEVTNKNSIKNNKETTEEKNDNNGSKDKSVESKKENKDNKENSEDSSKKEDTAEDATDNVEGSEIAVASTASFKNIYFPIVGSIVFLIGTSAIIIKTKKI